MIYAKASGKPSNPIGWGPELSVERVQVPLCRRCAFHRKYRFAVSFFVLFVVLMISALTAGLIFVIGGQNPNHIRFFAPVMIAVGGLGTILWHKWHQRNPVCFDVTDATEGLEFEFTNEEVARQFEELNGES